MAQRIVRHLDPDLVQRLRIRAAQHGRSMEAEHRDILRQVLRAPEFGGTLKAFLLAMPFVGEDANFVRRPDDERAIDLGTTSSTPTSCRSYAQAQGAT